MVAPPRRSALRESANRIIPSYGRPSAYRGLLARQLRHLRRPYELFTFLDPVAILNYPQIFDVVTCPAHRMTTSEWAKLRYARQGKRRQTFEQIKAAKLATD